MSQPINPLPDIRSRHATAIANRERGVIDSRDDDIGWLLGEVERLQRMEFTQEELAALSAKPSYLDRITDTERKLGDVT